MNTAKQRVLIYGNCQGEWLARNLLFERDFSECFEVYHVTSNNDSPEAQKMREPGFFSTCSHVLWQTAAGCKPPKFVENIPACCTQTRFPAFLGKFLWPLQATDPRNMEEPDFITGRYPYGDRLLIQLREKGLDPADIVKRYLETDIRTVVNLDRYEELCFSEMRFNDQNSDIKITPIVEEHFRQQQIFETINHPACFLMEQLRQIIVRIFTGHAAAPRPETISDHFATQEIPLHPQVIEHYKLQWVKPGHRWRYWANSLLYEEYIRDYAAYAPIASSHWTDLCLARAEYLITKKNIVGAKELLLEGARYFPQVPGLLLRLGQLHFDTNQLLDAEKVLRYAILQTPREASLYCLLGKTLAKRGFTSEAVRMYKTALQFEPNNTSARQNLSALQKPAKAYR